MPFLSLFAFLWPSLTFFFLGFFQILLPILIVVLMMLFGACAVCLLLRRRPLANQPARHSAEAARTSSAETGGGGNINNSQSQSKPLAFLSSLLPHRHEGAKGGEHTAMVSKPRPSQVAPFGNVVASNVPYVVQDQPMRQTTLEAAGPAGGRHGSIVYVREPYDMSSRGREHNQ